MRKRERNPFEQRNDETAMTVTIVIVGLALVALVTMAGIFDYCARMAHYGATCF